VNGTITCSICNEVIPFRLELHDRTFSLTGAIIPFSDELKVEFYRRGVEALCVACFQGKSVVHES